MIQEKRNIPIINLDLSTKQQWPVIADAEEYYLVFWWNQIPLMDIYLPKSEMVPEQIIQKVVERIFAEKKKSAELTYNIKQLSTDYFNDHNRFNQKLESVLNPPVQLQGPGSNELLSVVICTRNRHQSLDKCLCRLTQMKSQPGEIIVVDNNSSDDQTRLVCEKYEVRCVREERTGIDYARNTGAKLVSFPILAFVDDDVEVFDHWCEHIVESFADDSVGAMTGLVLAGELNTQSQQIFEKYWSFNRGFERKIYGKEYLKNNAPRVWEIGAGANMAFRTSVLKQLNYFDERLGAGAAGCSDDSEIWFRILDSGQKIVYNPLAVVRHQHRTDMSSLKSQLYYYIRGHVVAALIQDSYRRSGYRFYIFYELPKYYLMLFRVGFPAYRLRYSTLLSELSGLIAGVFYYRKYRKLKTVNQSW